MEDSYTADALLRILYTQQQHQKLLSLRPRTGKYSIKEGVIEIDGKRFGLIQSVGWEMRTESQHLIS
jgi:hypothetical protein